MAKGRKTKRAGRGKTPKASKASKAQKRSKYSRKKRKISRKRSLKGGMEPGEWGRPRLVRSLPGIVVDEYHVNPGPGTTSDTVYVPGSGRPPIIRAPGPIPIVSADAPGMRLTEDQVAALKSKYIVEDVINNIIQAMARREDMGRPYHPPTHLSASEAAKVAQAYLASFL